MLWWVYVASAVVAGFALLHVQVPSSAPHAVACVVYHLARQGAHMALAPADSLARTSVLAASSYVMLYRHVEGQKVSVVRPDVAIALSYACACVYDTCMVLDAARGFRVNV